MDITRKESEEPDRSHTTQNRTSVLDTRATSGADVDSDHKLMRCQLRKKEGNTKQ